MTAKSKTGTNRSERDIDQIVVAQANDDSAWEKPVRARRTKPVSLAIPAKLAARAAFLAQVHRNKNVDDWLAQVIQERIELEEAAFVGAKQELAAKTNRAR
jgi:hypothetical protein